MHHEDDSLGSSSPEQQPVSALIMLQKQREEKPIHMLHHWKFPLSHGITQLTGPAGSGKTQIALTLCVDSAFDGKKSLYVSLGSSIDGTWLTKISLRLRRMVSSNFSCTREQAQNDSHAAQTTHRLLSHVWLHGVRNTDDMTELLEEKLPRLLQQDPEISVVVMDSIANLFRISEDSSSVPIRKQDPQTSRQWKDRSSAFFKIATQCKCLSTVYHVPFIFVNDVTTKNVPNQSSFGSPAISKVEPALGLSWSQCVNTSYFATRMKVDRISSTTQTETCKDDDSARQAHRIGRVLLCHHSPTIPSGTAVEFQIKDRGAIPLNY